MSTRVPVHDSGPPGSASALEDLFTSHWLAMVRLAVLLVDDRPSAEDVVQDAFTGLHRHWQDLKDPGAAAAYLHRAVVNGCRSMLRRRRTARAWVAPHAVPGPSAEELVMLDDQRRQVLVAVAALPTRQREVLVLRYWSHLDEAQIAEAMGVSRGTVKSTTHKAIAAVERHLHHRPPQHSDQEGPR